MVDQPRRLAVLGSPISHSQSPVMHRAAYDVLGLDWSYDAVEVASGTLQDFVDTLDETWRGLSLTMPLKREVLPMLSSQDGVVDLVGAANTVLFLDGELTGFNTDVFGITRAMSEFGLSRPTRACLLGAGATAASALVALAQCGVKSVDVYTRSPHKAGALAILATRLGVMLSIEDFSQGGAMDPVDLLISTLPGDTALVREFSEEFRLATPLLDVAYDPWPTALAEHWHVVGGRAVSGLTVLLYQALAQVRVFTTGDAQLRLDNESEVFAAMRRSVAATSPAP